MARGVCEDNSTARDLFDTRLMGVLTPRPSIVRANFEERYEEEGPQAATDWFYEFSQDTDYIRRYRIKRDVKWVTHVGQTGRGIFVLYPLVKLPDDKIL